MFRTQNLVPEVYPDQSRDFQILCRLYDLVFNSTKQYIDSMQLNSSTMNCNSRVLPLLKTKVGFFSNVDLDEQDMRMILSAYPYIIRYKGSKRAIEYIVSLYSRFMSSSGSQLTIRPTNTDYTISIVSNSPVQKIDLIVDLLRYVIPTGYTVDYYKADSVSLRTALEGHSSVKTERNLYISKVIISKDDTCLSGTVNMASVADIEDIDNYLKLEGEGQTE